MKRLGLFIAHIAVGMLAWFYWAWWSAWTRAEGQRRYEHWSYRLLEWSDRLWWGEKGRPQ